MNLTVKHSHQTISRNQPLKSKITVPANKNCLNKANVIAGIFGAILGGLVVNSHFHGTAQITTDVPEAGNLSILYYSYVRPLIMWTHLIHGGGCACALLSVSSIYSFNFLATRHIIPYNPILVESMKQAPWSNGWR